MLASAGFFWFLEEGSRSLDDCLFSLMETSQTEFSDNVKAIFLPFRMYNAPICGRVHYKKRLRNSVEGGDELRDDTSTGNDERSSP